MSIFVQEELGLYKRNKRKTSLQLDTQKDWFQFGRMYNNASIGNPGYQPRMEPFILKLGDLKCHILQNVVLQNGDATKRSIPMYSDLSGSCATQNPTIAKSIIYQNSLDTSAIVAGSLGVDVDLTVKGNTELGTGVGDFTRIKSVVQDFNGALAGAANRVLRSQADGTVVWSDDDPVVALPQGNIWLGNASGIQSPLAPGAAGQLIVSNGTTLTYESITADAAGPQDGVIVSSAGGSPIKVGLTIKTLPNMGINVVDADTLVIYDSSADANKQVTISDFMDSIDVPDGSGTANRITKWIDADTIGDSLMTDDGTNMSASGYQKITLATVADNIDVDATGELQLDSASGIVVQAANTSIKTSFRSDVEIYNSKKLILGTGGNHMEIFHDGTNSQVNNNSGLLVFTQNVNDGEIKFFCDNGSGGTAEYVSINGQSETVTFSKNSKHLDDVKAVFGTSDDLEIYHDNLNTSYIKHGTTGDFRIVSDSTGYIKIMYALENMGVFIPNGAVELYHDNSKKIETTTTGVTVTGNANFADNGKALFGDSDDLQVYHGGGNSFITSNAGNLAINNSVAGSTIKIETGAGSGSDITLRSSDGVMALFQNGSGVELYYNGAKSAVVRNDGFELAAGGKYSLNQLNTAPSSATDTGRLGEIRYTADYIYVCVATNQWKRVALSTW